MLPWAAAVAEQPGHLLSFLCCTLKDSKTQDCLRTRRSHVHIPEEALQASSCSVERMQQKTENGVVSYL